MKCDPAAVHAQDDALGFDSLDGHTGQVGKPLIWIAWPEKRYSIDGGQAIDGNCDRVTSGDRFVLELPIAEFFGGGAEGECRRKGFETGTSRSFLFAAGDERFDAQPLADPERTDSCRSPELVATERKKVDPKFAWRDGDTSNRLGGIDMQQDVAISTSSSDFLHWLQRAYFMIAPLQVYQCSFWRELFEECVRVNATSGVDAHDFHASAKSMCKLRA
jgi:hypothetical protein